MAKNIAKTAKVVDEKFARDVAADLLGSPAKMTKAANKLAGKKAAKVPNKGAGNGAVGRPSPYTDKQRIVIVGKGKEPRKGSNIAKIWAMVAKSKTIADYKKQRAAAGLEGIGGLFAGLVKAGHVKVQ